MEVDNDADILKEIQEKYVPFLKKLISFLEKTKKATPENLERVKSIYLTFTTCPVTEQVEVFHKNQKKLQKWYSNSQKDKMDDSPASQGTKRPLVVDDTDSSQGVPDTLSKRSKDSESPVSNNSTNAIILQIKKEKVDTIKTTTPTPLPVANVQPIVISNFGPASNGNAVINVPQPEPNATPTDQNSSDELIFTCASCQFQTKDEQDFMKHTRTDHRSDLSMWCKQCGKCFSNAGVLVTHIKERACTKEDMIYRCGVKECTFETSSGQTFVHHLRHCHKGSPFIFCVHCQKIFTLPHCLILHMQDECPYKDKNRKNPGSTPAPPQPTTPAPAPTPVRPAVSFIPRAPVISAPVSIVSLRTVTPMQAISPRGRGMIMPSRGGRGGRGRGRGRGRPPSESSDSDDPDDPSWRPEETAENPTLRRSGRWAKKISDIINVVPKSTNKSMSMAELNNKEMFRCPCCDFMAAFKSVLGDHYIAHHKLQNKNACTVCHLKFESTQGFIDHFEDHLSGKLTNTPPVVDTAEPTKVQASGKGSQNEMIVDMHESSSSEPVPMDTEAYEGVVRNISEAENDNSVKTFIKIPYQSAIHDKNMRDPKLKTFEDLKAPSDLVSMKEVKKLKCFFKCVIYNCPFACHDNDEFRQHLETMHKGKRLHCGYCMSAFPSVAELTDHMLSEHSKRLYQCSHCFYRAYSKMHVKIHMNTVHAKDTNTEIFACDPIAIPSTIKSTKSEDIETTWPFVCAIGNCNFQNFDPKEFRKHNDTIHRTVTIFYCHYCKVDFMSLRRLMDHYRLHGINTFQCTYCIHGAETKADILSHLCNVHADDPLNAFMRGSEDDVSSETMLVPFSLHNPAEQALAKEKNQDDAKQEEDDATSPDDIKNRINFEVELYEVVGETYFPKYLRRICSDLVCGIPFCDEKFENVLAYIGHLRNAHMAANFPCPHCAHFSETWENFRNHLMCHGPGLYACGLVTCDFYDWDKHVVTKHLKSHNHTSAKVVIIREEDEEGSEMGRVKSLPQSCPFNIPEECFMCLFCTFTSSDRNVMKNHIYKEMAYKRFTCGICQEKCTSRKEVQAHFTKHEDSDIQISEIQNPEIKRLVNNALEKKFKPSNSKANQCAICSKNFKHFVQWQRHMQLCVGNHYQPYDCEYCKNSFSDLVLLKYHVDWSHFLENVKFSEVSSPEVKAEIDRKLQNLRLKYLNEVIGKTNTENDSHCLTKVYSCNVCSHEATHRAVIEKHMQTTPKCASAEITKKVIKTKVAEPTKDTTNDAKSIAKAKNDVKQYRCSFCIKKLHTLRELENHVEGHHSVQNEIKYIYYYAPDCKGKPLPEDNEKYECAYCKSGKDTLASLKKHCEALHCDMKFKVKGLVIRSRETLEISACGYCFHRVESNSELSHHFAIIHPTLSPKSIGGYGDATSKRLKEDDGLPNKRVRFGDTVFVCGHCGAAFSTHDLIATHGRRAHSRLPSDIKKISPSTDVEYSDTRFYKCEFCQFTSEKQYLEPHLAAKHKMRVTCNHCNKRFEFATKVREHHEVAHKGLPLKYSQETVLTIKKEPEDPVPELPADESPQASRSVPKKQPSTPTRNKARKQKSTLDLNKVTLVLKSQDKNDIKMTAMSFSQRYNIYPTVILKDIMKK